MANVTSSDGTVTYDPNKRALNIKEHGIDFEDCGKIFDDRMLTREDTREQYSAQRNISLGILGNKIVYFVWEERDLPHCISCREAENHEKNAFKKYIYR